MVRKIDLARAGMFVAVSMAAVFAEANPEKAMKMREESNKAEAELCQDLKALKVALTPMDTVKSTTKVQDIRNTLAAADKEIKDVRKSVKKLEDARLKELEGAYDSFKKAAQKLPGTETVGAAAPALTEEVEAIQTARERYNAPLNCQMEGSIGKDKQKQ